jgi:hypothetical protein
MNLRRQIRNARLILRHNHAANIYARTAFDLTDLVNTQSESIRIQSETIDLLKQERIDLMLGYSRISRDFIVNFLIALDQPEHHDEFREKLYAALTDLNDEVARLEEQTR